VKHRKGQDGLNVTLNSMPFSDKIVFLPPKGKEKEAAQ